MNRTLRYQNCDEIRFSQFFNSSTPTCCLAMVLDSKVKFLLLSEIVFDSVLKLMIIGRLSPRLLLQTI